MRAPLYTVVAVLALVAALYTSSLGSPSRAGVGLTDAATPLVGASGAAAIAPPARAPEPAALMAPDGITRDGRAAVHAASQGDAVAADDVLGPAEGPPAIAPTAWAAYDPRAERNARYRAQSLPRALAGLTAPETDAHLRFAYAMSVESAAIFTELDERRESFYVPDDGQRHPLVNLAGHHSMACGGANYVFAEGRFPVYDALVRLEDKNLPAHELEAWVGACPFEAALRERCAQALQRLGAYR